VLRATEERLKAELNGRAEVALPVELEEFAHDPVFKSVWNAQIQQFQSRRTAIEGQRKVLKQRIAQLESQITGAQGQLKSYNAQIESVRKEMASLLPLLEKGLIPRPRYLSLERSGTGLEGQVADVTGNIAKARQTIAEQMQQTAQLDYDRMTEVSKELRETQGKLLEVESRQANARAVLNRVEIRSPYSGKVVGLNVFSVGGVIQRGEKILDIVPERDSLIIEAQVAVEDIADVHPEMRADIHLVAYKQRIAPVVEGQVVQVSADRLTDPKSGAPYYVAQVRVDEQQLAELPHVKLYPGMPATVMIPTVERTALDYLVGPLTMMFNLSFRQK